MQFATLTLDTSACSHLSTRAPSPNLLAAAISWRVNLEKSGRDMKSSFGQNHYHHHHHLAVKQATMTSTEDFEYLDILSMSTHLSPVSPDTRLTVSVYTQPSRVVLTSS